MTPTLSPQTPPAAPAAPAPSVRRATTYLRYELLRALRNGRFLVFSLVFPLVLFLLVAGANRHQSLGGIPFSLYYMTGMVAWGTMGAVVAGGARIAVERSVGWNRQLRVTPLRASTYLLAKVVAGYAAAACSIVLLYSAGLSIGVRLAATRWLLMTAMILIGLVPFAVLGIYLGHVLTPEAVGPAMGGLVSLLALLGGAWGPLGSGGFVHQVSSYLPSYWLVQAGKVALGGGLWPAKGWFVLAAWTLVLGRFAARAWQRDTLRA